MRTVFSEDYLTNVLTALITVAVGMVLLYLFIRFWREHPIHKQVFDIIYHVVFSAVFLVGMSVFLGVGIVTSVYSYHMNENNCDTMEGTTTVICCEEKWIARREEPLYEMTVKIDDTVVKSATLFEKDVADALSSASYIKIYYCKFGLTDALWIWKIEATDQALRSACDNNAMFKVTDGRTPELIEDDSH